MCCLELRTQELSPAAVGDIRVRGPAPALLPAQNQQDCHNSPFGTSRAILQRLTVLLQCRGGDTFLGLCPSVPSE